MTLFFTRPLLGLQRNIQKRENIQENALLQLNLRFEIWRLKDDSLHLNQWTECPRIDWWTRKHLVWWVWNHFLRALWCHRPTWQWTPPSLAAAAHNHTHKHEVHRLWIRVLAQKSKNHIWTVLIFLQFIRGAKWCCIRQKKYYLPGCAWPGSPESFLSPKKGNLSPGNVWPTYSLNTPVWTRWRWSSGKTSCLWCTAWCWLQDTLQKISHGNIREHYQARMGGIKPHGFIH